MFKNRITTHIFGTISAEVCIRPQMQKIMEYRL